MHADRRGQEGRLSTTTAMVLDLLKRYARRSAALKRLHIWYRSGQGDLPDWDSITSPDRAHWQSAIEAAKSGPPVLMATSTGNVLPAVNLEGFLAAALTMRGANVHLLLCDEVLPACLLCGAGYYPDQQQFVRHGPARDLCKACYKPAYRVYQSLGLTVHRYSELLSGEDRRQAETTAATLPFDRIGSFSLDGIAVGEHALAGALRFYARGNLEGEPYAEPVLRRYLRASLLTTLAVRRLLATTRFDAAVFHHGIYVPQGLTGEVCRKMAVRVINWNSAYRKKCFVFSHGDTYHHTLMSEPVSKWENMPWDAGIEKQAMDYLKSRWYGTNDWISFHDAPQEDLDEITRQVGVDFAKPCIGMLTNVMWDAQLHYPANAFPNMLAWVLQTIEYFSRRPQLQLLVRVHPAEITGKPRSRQLIIDEIKKAFPVLPGNIFIVPPQSRVSTYAAMTQCDSVIIFGTKTGVELTAMGIPVIVAGEAWVRNKGITLDATSAADYFQLLDKLPLKRRLDEATIERARKYAYHFFLRRMIPLEHMEPSTGESPFKVQLSSVRDLEPGRSRGLDIICDGILKGADFIYPAELIS